MQVESKVDFLMSAWSSPGVTMVGDNVLVVKDMIMLNLLIQWNQLDKLNYCHIIVKGQRAPIVMS